VLLDDPNLWRYARDLFRQPAISETVNFGHSRKHYDARHKAINPKGIVPIGPELNFTAEVHESRHANRERPGT
jgi:glutathionyl-hydroquinone reductase